MICSPTARGLGTRRKTCVPATYETLFGLIASTGLRLSEAVHLLDADVDFNARPADRSANQVQQVPPVAVAPQFDSRLAALPAAPSSVLSKERPEAPFFVGTRGKHLGEKLSSRQVDRVFNGLRKQLGWINRGAHDAPRIHDLRHTFAVRRVLLWHEQGTDIDQAMLALSTYMGHAKISHTYWYLTAVPELMVVAAREIRAVLRRHKGWTMSSKTTRHKEPSISFPALVQEFFTHYLVEQRALSPRDRGRISGYLAYFFLTFPPPTSGHMAGGDETRPTSRRR